MEENVDGKNVMLVCPQSSPANDTVMETLLLISSLKRNGAKNVFLYIPYSAYARQDKMVGPWRSLGYSDVASFYEASGVNKVVTLDIHNEAVMGCFNQSINAKNMTAVEIAAQFISQVQGIHNLTVLSPDEGGVKRAKKFFDHYQHTCSDNPDSNFVIMLKNRTKPNEVASMTLTGDVRDRDCILIDDMIDTGGTLITAAKMLKENGARKIYVFATHGIFNNDFYQRVDDSTIDSVFVTNSLPPKSTHGVDESKKIVRISMSKYFADLIYQDSENI
jgi:ribose-phosphate pyrophosphokinase